MAEMNEIREAVRTYLLENHLEGAEDELTDSTPLVTSGILDSVSTLQFIAFLEQKFGIEFSPSEVDQDNLNTIDRIVPFVSSKLRP